MLGSATTFKVSKIRSETQYHPQSSRSPRIHSTQSSLDSTHSSFPTPNLPAMSRLQFSLAALSEDQLRKMVTRVASKDPYFCDVIAMELGEIEANCSDVDDALSMTSVTDPSPRKNRKRSSRWCSNRPRTLSNTFVHFPPTSISTESDQDECHCYHSGHLETEEYEFLTRTIGDQTFGVQTVFMWSCCEGDETSPGCTTPTNHHSRPRLANLSRHCPRKKSKTLPVRHRRA